MSEKYKGKKNNSKNKKSGFTIKNHKKIKNIYFRFFYVIIVYFVKALINIFKILFTNIKKILDNKKKYKNYDNKVFSYRCSFMMALIVILSVLFVYMERSMIYIYPILTCVVPIMILSEGINSDIYNQYKDLSLCNKILKINTFAFLLLYIIFNEKIWFIKFSMILIFIVPLIIGNVNKEKHWKKYE